MNLNKEYPKVIVGVFIFNKQNELLLVKAPKWKNKYICIGGHVEMNETLIETAKREVKEETGLDLKDIELVGITDGQELEKFHHEQVNHYVFINYKADVSDDKNIKLNNEIVEPRWLSLKEWLKKDETKFAPYIYGILEDLNENEKNNFEDLYRRALADYQNLLKQTAIEKQEIIKFANERLLHEIFPVYDNLKLALKHSENVGQIKNGIDEGLKYVLKQFKDALENFGVTEIKTVGEKFDHNTMEAIDKQITDDKDKDGLVAEELKGGYMLNSKVIEHARVIVWEAIK